MRGWLLALVMLSWQAFAQEEKQNLFRDPRDGAIDASEWLVEKKGFLPVPILITEPAIGYGAGMGLMFVRNSIRERSTEGGHVAPPDVFGVALAATENGSKFAGGGGLLSFDQDRWRYRGGVGRAQINLDFYGAGGQLGTSDRKIGYQLDALASTQQVLYRLGETSNFVGARWIYFDADASFDASRPQPALPPRALNARSSGAGFTLEHDSRDNIFTPSRGMVATFEPIFYSPDFGGDNKFETYRARMLAYAPVAKTLVLGGRADARAARGDTPFYQLPYLDMRGIPAVRYQDGNVALAEAELRWNVTPRWAAVGFLGAGRVWGSGGTGFGDAGTVVTKGVGFRYLIASRLGIYMGADVARGPEETAFYIQVGSAWR